MKTVFEKIIDGEIPATKVYEDDKFLAFLDIAPKVYGHTLVIPKEKYVWMQEAPDELIAEMFVQTKKIMLAIKKSLGCDYVEVRVVGEEVPYFHIHIIPHNLNEAVYGLSRKSYESNGQMSEYADKIKSQLQA
jgi:histidine triad (HIT) family protein